MKIPFSNPGNLTKKEEKSEKNYFTHFVQKKKKLLEKMFCYNCPGILVQPKKKSLLWASYMMTSTFYTIYLRILVVKGFFLSTSPIRIFIHVWFVGWSVGWFGYYG